MKRNRDLDDGVAVAANDGAVPGKVVRPYSRPKIISAEDLEAAASTCDPPVGVTGKTPILPTFPCSTPGS